MNSLLGIGAVHVLIMVVAVVRAKVVSHVLGVDGFGVVGAIDQTVISLTQLGALSLPLTALKVLSARHSESIESFQAEFATFFRGISAVAVFSTLAGLGVLFAAPGIYGAELAPYRTPFVIALIGVPAAILALLFANTLAAAQRGTESALLNLVVLGSLAMAATTGVFVGGIGGLYIATSLAGVVTTIGALAYLRRRLGVRLGGRRGGLIAELRGASDIVRYALLLYTALAAYSVTMVATRYFALAELGESAAGLLQALLAIALSVGAALTSMNAFGFAPRVNRRAEPAEKIAEANSFARKTLGLLMVGGVAVALFPGLTLNVLYTADFVAAAPSLSWFLVWQLCFLTANVYLQTLIGLDDVAVYAAITVGIYAGAALLFPRLVESAGLVGVAYALTATTATGLAVTAVRLRAKFGGLIAPGVVVRALGTGAAIVGAGLLFNVESELTPAGIGMRAVYGAMCMMALWFMLEADEREFIQRGVTWLRRS